MSNSDINTNSSDEALQNNILNELLSKLSSKPSGSPQDTAAQRSSADSASQSASTAPSGDILSSLLANPELIAKLPSIISSIKPIIDMLGKSGLSGNVAKPAAQEFDKGENTIAASAVSPTAKASHKYTDSRSALLCAMKPYLSSDRQVAIDYIIKLAHLGDILKTL